ncbi:MAG TPA: tRNA (adenosine(37)-N6)-threonylcarbamoyltransferase complex ATPase subunit type 1 TsaE [Candidatus Saccharimonadales bacterium]|nr:tRNA (adenosine(37)-N6)-threonylcarbamoyltransferase complex ATPase subunit type 1 TsaE [Candidatus Saccharimonadales bacterium]
MSTEQTWQTTSAGLEETLKIAEAIGRKLKGGEVFELVSDLGGGKTAFVRGLAKGMGSKDAVRSPSFTLSNEYRSDSLTLYHFDFYRLHDPGIMKDELAEAITDPKGIVAVEWAEIVENVLPAERITIRIKATGEHSREITVKYPQAVKYLFNE